MAAPQKEVKRRSGQLARGRSAPGLLRLRRRFGRRLDGVILGVGAFQQRCDCVAIPFGAAAEAFCGRLFRLRCFGGFGLALELGFGFGEKTRFELLEGSGQNLSDRSQIGNARAENSAMG